MDEKTVLEILVVAIGGGSAKLLGKALGPIFDDVGGVIKNYTEKGIANLGRVFKHMLKTLGSKLEKPGQVPPKILRDVLYHGYVCEDSPRTVARLCVTIGRYWYLFKRLTAFSAGRFYRFERIVAYSSGKVIAK